MKRLFLILSITVLVSALVLGGCAQPAPAPKPAPAPAPKPAPAITPGPTFPKSLAIATLAKGTGNNTVGAAMAKVLTANLPTSATDRPLGAYAQFIPMVDKGEIDLAHVSMQNPWFGYTMQYIFKDTPMFNIRNLTATRPLLTTYLATPASGVKSWADAKGKRVTSAKATGGGAVHKRFQIIFKFYGVDLDKDTIVVPAESPADAARFAIEGKADLFHNVVASSALIEAEKALGGLTWLFESEEANKATAPLLLEAGLYPEARYYYENLPGPGLGGPPGGKGYFASGIDSLVAHKDMPEEVAYLIVKTIWEKIEDIRATHPAAQDWTRENSFVPPGNDFTAIFHPGAIRFFKEVGRWTPAAEKQNQFLIATVEQTKKKLGIK